MTGRAEAVVVRWRGGNEVESCLRSVIDNGGPELAGALLVDSGSGDGGGERLAERIPGLRLLALAENRSFAHAADEGVAATAAPLVLLLNPDTVLQADALDLLCRHLDANPRVAGAVPLLTSPDGALQHRWQLRRLPTPARLALGLPGRPLDHVPGAPAPVPQPAAAAWLLRREVWDALGGLDRRFAPAWWEDVDLCARLADRLGDPGFPAEEGFAVVPEARVLHEGGGSAARLGDAAFQVVFICNLLRYAARHHPHRLGWLRAGLVLSLTARALGRPLRSRPWREAARAVRRADLAELRREMQAPRRQPTQPREGSCPKPPD